MAVLTPSGHRFLARGKLRQTVVMIKQPPCLTAQSRSWGGAFEESMGVGCHGRRRELSQETLALGVGAEKPG